MKRFITVLVLVGLLVGVGVIAAQSSRSFHLRQSVVAGGGSRSASASFQLQGTIGQAAAGPPVARSNQFHLHGGFWPPLSPPVLFYDVYLPMVAR